MEYLRDFLPGWWKRNKVTKYFTITLKRSVKLQLRGSECCGNWPQCWMKGLSCALNFLCESLFRRIQFGLQPDTPAVLVCDNAPSHFGGTQVGRSPYLYTLDAIPGVSVLSCLLFFPFGIRNLHLVWTERLEPHVQFRRPIGEFELAMHCSKGHKARDLTAPPPPPN